MYSHPYNSVLMLTRSAHRVLKIQLLIIRREDSATKINSRVNPDPLSDDRLIKGIELDVITVGIAQEQLGRAVHSFVIDKVFTVAAILDHKLLDILVTVGSTLGSNARDILDRAQIHQQSLFKVRVFCRPSRSSPEDGQLGRSLIGFGGGRDHRLLHER